VRERLGGGTSSPDLGLKPKTRGCERDTGVGTPSPQLCAHIWPAQPSPGTAAQHRSSRQMLRATGSPPPPNPARARGSGRVLFPLLCPIGSTGLGYGSCPLPPCQEQRCQARALAVTTAKPGPGKSPPQGASAQALVPKTRGLCQAGGGREAAAAPKPPRQHPEPRPSCPSPTPQRWVSAPRDLLGCPCWVRPGVPPVPPPAARLGTPRRGEGRAALVIGLGYV